MLEAEDENRVEHDVDNDRTGHHVHRRERVAVATHQRHEDGEAEDGHETDRVDLHVLLHQRCDLGAGTEQREQFVDEEVADGTENERGDHRVDDRLGGGVLGSPFLPGTGVLGDEHAARDREPERERDQQEHHRERETDRGQRGRVELPEPERITEVVGGLEEVLDDDRQGEIEQRFADAARREIELLAGLEQAAETAPEAHSVTTSRVMEPQPVEPRRLRVVAPWSSRRTAAGRTAAMVLPFVLFVDVVIRVRSAPEPHSYSVREAVFVISVIVSSVIVGEC